MLYRAALAVMGLYRLLYRAVWTCIVLFSVVYACTDWYRLA